MKVTRILPCELSERELQERSDELANEVAKLREVEAEKREVMREFGDRIKAHDLVIDSLSKIVRDRSEEKEVPCLVVWNAPKRGMKQIIRLDTNEVVDELDMTDNDKQRAADEQQLPLPGLEVVR